MFSKFSPPIHKKVLQNHFHVILSDLSLDAPVRPVSKRDLLDEPGRRGVSPQKSGTPWYVPLIWTQINCKVHFFKLPESYNLHFYNYQHCTHDFDL